MSVTELTAAAVKREQTPTLRIGVRAHDFGCASADALAARIAAQGFCCVQLALNKAIAGLSLQAGELNAKLARDIGGAFARHGVEIEVLGCYINPIHPDRSTRARLVEFFTDHLRYARDFGCGLVALETGSLNADYSPHPDNHGEAAFSEFLATLEELLDSAERFDVSVGIEGVIHHVVSNPRKMRQVLDALPSTHLSVVLDPVNLLSSATAQEQARIVTQALEWYGDRVAVVHAKDFLPEGQSLKTVPAGHGELDYGLVLQFLREQTVPPAVLIEEADESMAGTCARWLQEAFQEVAR